MEIDNTSFDKKVQWVLVEYHQRIQDESKLMKDLPIEEGMKRRDEFLLPVGEEVGRFLNEMVKASKPKIILEIGTSYGYSTIWLAEAARQVNAKVITLELDEKKVDYTKKQLDKAGLSAQVEFRVGDALEHIQQAKEFFDFVLLDIWKELYVPSFLAFLPKLNTGAYIVADNILFPPNHKKEAAAYRKAIRDTAAFDSVLLPLGSGIEISCKL